MIHHESPAKDELNPGSTGPFGSVSSGPALRTERECQKFFSDLCTPAELEALVDRWAVVAHLADGLPYRKIHDLTGVSVTTIGRVARFLTAGNDGYQIVLKRLRPL